MKDIIVLKENKFRNKHSWCLIINNVINRMINILLWTKYIKTKFYLDDESG